MKYIICHGNGKVKYLYVFNAIEDCITYLHSMYDFVYVNIQKVRSLHVMTECYNCNLCYKGYDNNIDLLIYGVKDYEEKEI